MVMKALKNVAAALIGVAAAAASVAHAVPVTLWNYDVLTKFAGTNTFSAGTGTQVQTETQVSWGGSGSVFTSGSERSGITIADTGPGANDPTASDILGTVTTNAVSIPGIGLAAWITHHNNPISGSYSTLLTSKISSTLTLTPNTPATPGQLGPATLDFTVYFAETPNAAPCAAASPTPCNDIFALNASEAFNQTFGFDGETYYVSLFPISGGGLSTFLPLTSAECVAAGANAGCVGFTTVEAQDTTVRFGFAVTQQQIDVIPEPGTLALAGLALAALGFRRQKSK
jgi:hypothetical protein